MLEQPVGVALRQATAAVELQRWNDGGERKHAGSDGWLPAEQVHQPSEQVLVHHQVFQQRQPFAPAVNSSPPPLCFRPSARQQPVQGPNDIRIGFLYGDTTQTRTRYSAPGPAHGEGQDLGPNSAFLWSEDSRAASESALLIANEGSGCTWSLLTARGGARSEPRALGVEGCQANVLIAPRARCGQWQCRVT
eukprot:3847323-Rhodomonas_salina.1